MAAPTKPQDYRRSTKNKGATSVDQWRKSKMQPLDLPSGNTALVRAIGIQTFIKQGLVPNTLLPMVQKALKGEKEDVTASEVLEKMDLSTEEFAQMLDMIDAVVVACVVQPKVFAQPKGEDGEPLQFDQREEIDGLWVDEVDDEDKSFIFQFTVGGTRDLETFRTEQARQLESLPHRADVESQAE